MTPTELARDLDGVMDQLRERVREVKEHGYGRVEVIIKDGQVTTIHAQKSWARRRERGD